MDPILKIVNYILKKRNINTTVENFNSFFDNGVDFPQFVAAVFNVDTIPSINKNPKTIYHRQVNNSLAVQFLFKNNSEIAKISPTFNTDRDKINLIALILTKQCFKINYQDILNKCNLIVRPLGFQFTKKSDLLDKKCISSLFNVLTDGEVKFDDESYNFDDLMTQIFKKAQVPLVINKTSLEIQNQFTFFIQLEIIFNFYSDKIRKLKEGKDEPKTVEIENEPETENDDQIEIEKEEEKRKVEPKVEEFHNSIEYDDDDEDVEKINDSALLNVINSIGNESFHFTSIRQTIEKDNLPKFVKILLNDKSDLEAIDKIIDTSTTTAEKINEVIKYLGEIRRPNEPLFKVIRFNFEEQKYALLSADKFYINFLDSYFLKANKFELYERCSTIIFGNIKNDDAFYLMYIKNIEKNKNPYNDKDLLLKWDTYLALVNFVNQKSTHYQIDKTKNDDYYFKQNNIPQIIDRKYLKSFSKKVPDIVFYQLQFIFDVLDKKGFVYYFHEYFLKTERLIKKVKVPSFKLLSENMKLRCKRFITSDNSLTYQQRRQKNSESLKELLNENISDPFWSPVDKTVFFDKGVLCKVKSDIKAIKLWFNEIVNFHNTVSVNQSVDKSKTLFTAVNIENVKSKLYKFFYYDEALKKWQIDSSSIQQFINEKQYDLNKVRTPLVLFSNAYEKDLIKINSIFINSMYPELDDDNIYVYALSDKSVNLLQYNITLPDADNNNDDQIKPIFLLLHVPKNKTKLLQKDDDIKTILFKIYYFLSIICDIEIDILNKEHCLEQLDLIKAINNVKRSYKLSAVKKLHKKSENKLLSKSEIEINEMNKALDNSDFNIWEKNSKYIILLNDDTIYGDFIKPEESDFVNYIKKKINCEYVDVHHININEPVTYRGFLTSFNKFANKVDTLFKYTFESFDLYPLTNISSLYINLKSKDEWRSDLKSIIDNRFNQLLDADCAESSEFVVLSKLESEIVKYCPAIDLAFYSECFLILNEIKHFITQKNKRLIKFELRKSSDINLAKIADDKDSLSSGMENEIKSNHKNFLKDEFFNIVNKLFGMDDPDKVINENQAILENQIQQDAEKIQNIFDKCKK